MRGRGKSVIGMKCRAWLPDQRSGPPHKNGAAVEEVRLIRFEC